MSDDRDQATHLATPVRIRASQATGNIPLSRELAATISWIGALAVLLVLGGGLWQQLQTMASTNLQSFDISKTTGDSIHSGFAQTRSIFFQSLLPIMAAIAVFAAASFGMQTRFAIFPNLFGLDVSRIDPLQNALRIGALPSWSNAFFGLVKLVVFACIACWIVAGDLKTLFALSGMELGYGIDQSALWVAASLIKLCVGALVVGLADYGLRWWHHRYMLQMTDQEIRDEQRSMEPSPEIESRRRMMRRRSGQRWSHRL